MQPAAKPVHSDVSSLASSTVCGPQQWSPLLRFAFRVSFSYIVLYLSYFLIDHAEAPVPLVGAPYVEFWNIVAPWVGVRVLGLDSQDAARAGGGDVLAVYVLILIFVVLSVLSAGIWSLLDRTRSRYDTLHGWLRFAVRYSLFFVMIDYGTTKLFPLQFKPPKFWTLLSPYGEFAPSDILWEFMGVSQGYTIFTGAVEVLGALLLLSARTTTIGAIILCAALMNVVMLNLSYDIGVKLYSIHLLLLSTFLLTPELRSLMNLLVFRRATVPAFLPTPIFGRRWMRVAVFAISVAFIGSVLYKQVSNGWMYYGYAYVHPELPAVHGLFEVESFSRNGQEIPPLMTERTRWQRVSFDTSWSGKGPGYVHVRTMDESPNQWTRFRFNIESDRANSSITLIGRSAGKVVRHKFTYRFVDETHVLLDGNLERDTVVMRLRKVDTSKYVLTKRRFRWVQPNSLGRPTWARVY